MAKQLVPDVAEFRLIQEFTDPNSPVVPIQSTLYVRNTLAPGWGESELQTTADEIRDAWEAEVLPLLCDNLVLVRVEGEDLGADPGVQVVSVSGTAGTIATEHMPSAVCALVQFLCDSGSLPKRGAMFISGLAEADVEGNDLAEAFRTALQSAINDVHTAIGGAVLGNAVVRISRTAGTPAELAAVQAARDDLRAAIAATRRSEGVSNTLAFVGVRDRIAIQRDRRD